MRLRTPDIKPPVVWIISSEYRARTLMRAELIGRGFQAIGFKTLHEALATFDLPDFVKPRVFLLDLFGLQYTPSELVALATFPAPAILLGGHVELNSDLVGELDWAAVLRRPFTVGAAADAVEKAFEAM